MGFQDKRAGKAASVNVNEKLYDNTDPADGTCINDEVYEIHPRSSYRIIRNCSGCGCKTSYVNTGNFRINANGNKVDIWLIYQCEKCRHTYNLTLYERVSPASVGEDYRHFQENSQELALSCGCDKGLFQRNRAEIDLENIEYSIIPVKKDGRQQGDTRICIQNPFELKIRTEKILAEILDISRSQLKKMMKEGRIEAEGRYIGKEMEIVVRKERD